MSTRNESSAEQTEVSEVLAKVGAVASTGMRPQVEELHTSDPERIHALAHPLRLKLIDLIQDRGEVTASEAAEHLGQTVANCSFHLRVLEKAGFVERAEPRGREKPWRSSSKRRRLEPDLESRASVLALTELVGVTLTHIGARFTDYVREHLPKDDPAWRELTLLDQASVWVTAEEAEQIAERIVEATAPFRERRYDPSLRPEGARIVRLTSILHPDPPQPAE